MRRNFEQVELKRLSGNVDIVDLRSSLGDMLYNSAMHIPVRKMAEKIYYSKGETEFTKEELDLLKNEIETKDFNLFLRVKEAIIELSTIKNEESC